MSSDQELARLWKVQTSVNKLILDGKRSPAEVADVLQRHVIDVKPKAAEVQKFALLKDLGIITVPRGYVSATWLDSFAKKERQNFFHYNDDITSANFSHPSRILKPGDRLRVRAFKQIVSGETTSEECLAFLRSRQAVLVGAHGAALVFKQKRDSLPKGFWYLSFDEKENLREDSDGYHRVPDVRAYSDGDFGFNLGGFEGPWRAVHCLLVFCDLPAEASAKAG